MENWWKGCCYLAVFPFFFSERIWWKSSFQLLWLEWCRSQAHSIHQPRGVPLHSVKRTDTFIPVSVGSQRLCQGAITLWFWAVLPQEGSQKPLCSSITLRSFTLNNVKILKYILDNIFLLIFLFHSNADSFLAIRLFILLHFPAEGKQNIKHGERGRTYLTPMSKDLQTQSQDPPRTFRVSMTSLEDVLCGIRWKGYLFTSNSAINCQQGALHTSWFLWAEGMRQNLQ